MWNMQERKKGNIPQEEEVRVKTKGEEEDMRTRTVGRVRRKGFSSFFPVMGALRIR